MGLDPNKIQKLSSLASGTLKKSESVDDISFKQVPVFLTKKNPDPVCSKCEKQTGQI